MSSRFCVRIERRWGTAVSFWVASALAGVITRKMRITPAPCGAGTQSVPEPSVFSCYSCRVVRRRRLHTVRLSTPGSAGQYFEASSPPSLLFKDFLLYFVSLGARARAREGEGEWGAARPGVVTRRSGGCVKKHAGRESPLVQRKALRSQVLPRGQSCLGPRQRGKVLRHARCGSLSENAPAPAAACRRAPTHTDRAERKHQRRPPRRTTPSTGTNCLWSSREDAGAHIPARTHTHAHTHTHTHARHGAIACVPAARSHGGRASGQKPRSETRSSPRIARTPPRFCGRDAGSAIIAGP